MYNGHADVTALLNTAGNVVATYYYDAFGNILVACADGFCPSIADLKCPSVAGNAVLIVA
jgi:hypothetical protein